MNVVANTKTARRIVFCILMGLGPSVHADSFRQYISLDGQWQVAEGSLDKIPDTFGNSAPVPGLLDMARPSFNKVGFDSNERQAFWYKRQFKLDRPAAPIVQLKINKAAWSSRVYLNGKLVGEHASSFTPGFFNIGPYLKWSGDNEIIIRIGALPNSVPGTNINHHDTAPGGWDYQKTRYQPGIYDSVNLIIMGAATIIRTQVAPDLINGQITVQTVVRNNTDVNNLRIALKYIVREKNSGKLVAKMDGKATSCLCKDECTILENLKIPDCRLWSPEDPFLYTLTLNTSDDEDTTDFGMRTYKFDIKSGKALFNNRPRYLRGTNVAIWRFFEDPQHGDLAWNEQWVRKLYHEFKNTMHWDSFRMSIGFGPEIWYRIADEEGLVIQDEFPIWELSSKISANDLAPVFAEWMHDRANHPSVIIWDGSNETLAPQIAETIKRVRQIDLSNRPWENSMFPPLEPTDCWEAHPYREFINSGFRISSIGRMSDFPHLSLKPVTYFDPPFIIINEYGLIWLDSNCDPTSISCNFYNAVLGSHSTREQRLRTYAKYIAAQTEWWRASRKAAAVMHFSAVTYSMPQVVTSHNFVDINNVVFEPSFKQLVGDSFYPVGVMLRVWPDTEKPAAISNHPQTFTVTVTNDLCRKWIGNITFRFLNETGSTVYEDCQCGEVDQLGQENFTFVASYPSKPGNYTVEAVIQSPIDNAVKSIRGFRIVPDNEYFAKEGIARYKPVRASSQLKSESTDLDYYTKYRYSARYINDGAEESQWSSVPSDPQWICIDLECNREIARINLLWDQNAYASDYNIAVSKDGCSWQNIFETQGGHGGLAVIRFKPIKARWVRVNGFKRSDEKQGYIINEMRVFDK